MKITEFKIQGPLLFENQIFPDERGFFTERFRGDRFRKAGLEIDFVQENFSISNPGVLRGLHYQFDPPQAKLITCVSGKIFDVLVDIRPQSPSFGDWISVELDGDKPQWLWAPAGFAHGFCVLGNTPAGVLYKVDHYWSKDGESGLRWDDPSLNIQWPIKNPKLSPKDLELASFTEYRRTPKFK